MSILIKGMEMPKAGAYTCELGVLDENTAVLTINTPIDEPQRSYRLIPVPPHGRLGDLDRLEQMFVDIDNAPYSAFDGEAPFYSAEDAAQIIRLAPTIIEAEGGDAQ